jgi:hypothetical protein
VEGLFVGDAHAVREILLQVLGEDQPDLVDAKRAIWTEAQVRAFLDAPTSKPSKALVDLAHGMGTEYRKRGHGRLLAGAVSVRNLECARDVLAGWLSTPTLGSARNADVETSRDTYASDTGATTLDVEAHSSCETGVIGNCVGSS